MALLTSLRRRQWNREKRADVGVFYRAEEGAIPIMRARASRESPVRRATSSAGVPDATRARASAERGVRAVDAGVAGRDGQAMRARRAITARAGAPVATNFSVSLVIRSTR